MQPILLYISLAYLEKQKIVFNLFLTTCKGVKFVSIQENKLFCRVLIILIILCKFEGNQKELDIISSLTK